MCTNGKGKVVGSKTGRILKKHNISLLLFFVSDQVNVIRIKSVRLPFPRYWLIGGRGLTYDFRFSSHFFLPLFYIIFFSFSFVFLSASISLKIFLNRINHKQGCQAMNTLAVIGC